MQTPTETLDPKVSPDSLRSAGMSASATSLISKVSTKKRVAGLVVAVVVLVVLGTSLQDPLSSTFSSAFMLQDTQHVLIPYNTEIVQYTPETIHSSKVLFSYFHKSGNNLMRKVMFALGTAIGADAANVQGIKRKPIRIDSPLIWLEKEDWISGAAPEVTPESWAATVKAWPTIRMITSLRDPFAMAISGWAYHSNAPTKEAWAYKVQGSFCEDTRNLEMLKGIQSQIKLKDEDLEAVRKLCQELEVTIPRYEKKNYVKKLQFLNSVDPVKALMFEATRLILRGDLVRMVYHALVTQGEATVLHVYLSQFTRSSDDFDRMIDCMCTFLGIDAMPNIEEAKNKVRRLADLHRATKTSKEHVTSSSIDHEERTRLMQAMRDSLIGPLLDRCREIVFAAVGSTDFPSHCNVRVGVP